MEPTPSPVTLPDVEEQKLLLLHKLDAMTKDVPTFMQGASMRAGDLTRALTIDTYASFVTRTYLGSTPREVCHFQQ